ncbi:Phosphatidylinositol 3,4,5-trisphosphate-dependent Rac exchanger 2 protein [Exophiala sideris]|nr:Phosphatidylinositol 3,4,5-trisphosphate-dependent Rac exchanger 2 protein [Exophiala sideris]KAK5187107.1 Phosphatidylinositol 3,4,5-trisphosphate-dependent Rac exchanger 2 protein [Eurotiomycetes sp. CCFEE 6388]
MTGLNPQTDTIMSISAIITTSDLTPLDTTGFDATIHHTPTQLSSMSEWCVRTHGTSGLSQACLESSTTAQIAASALLTYIKRYIPEPRLALLAGNSIHADKSFLMVPPWNAILEHLHYRLFDVSATKEMIRRWAPPKVLAAAPQKANKHTAREDILESLEEAWYYMHLIRSLSPAAATATGLNVAGAVPVPATATNPTLGLKQAQEESHIRRNRGTRQGDVGQLDEGFRTDVP